MKSNWSQSTLFPQSASVTYEVRIGIHQESGRIGVWIEGRKQPTNHVISNDVSWFNHSQDGILAVLQALHDVIVQDEEHHGLSMAPVNIPRDSAPF